MTWLDNICNVLEHPQYPQIRGRLIKRNNDDSIMGKCALGEINCQIRGKEPSNYVFLTGLEQSEIGIPDEFVESNLPDFNPNREETFYEDIHTDLTSWIVALNDSGYTYPEIIEFLKTTFPEEISK